MRIALGLEYDGGPFQGWQTQPARNTVQDALEAALAQIDRTNVAQLQVAWTYRTGALAVKTDNNRKAAFEATPILVAGRLYLTTPYDHVIALDPASGAKLWEYDPGLDLSRNFSEVTSRGVAAWRDTSAPPP